MRARDLLRQGLARSSIERLVAAGVLERVGRGLFVPADVEVTEHHSLVEAICRVPAGTVCLLSALAFHGLGTQSPHEVWLAIDHKARKPKSDGVPLRVVRFSGRALTHGVQRYRLEGVMVPVTTPAKTVADCFKYREKIGLDVAMQALRTYLQQRGRSMDDLIAAASVCRVSQVMKPYIEAMVA